MAATGAAAMTLTKTAKIPAASLKPAFSNTKNAVKPIQANQTRQP